MPLLTVVLTLDVEKPAEYDDVFTSALEWSAGESLDKVQVVPISQRESTYPRNRDGYPVWDVFADVRSAWDRIEGEYVTLSHTEFCWGPGRLHRTVEALDSGRPTLALGNLRRLSPAGKHRREGQGISRHVVRLVQSGQWQRLATWWNSVRTYPWAFWYGEPSPGPTGWAEDVFFAKRSWLERIRFFEHCHKMPFQDVYDVMGVCVETLRKHHRAPTIFRLSRNVCDIVHLAHDKTWGAYTPAMRDWFFERRCEWEESPFLREDLWRRVLEGEHPGTAVREFRTAPGGTITAWHSQFSGWLQNGMA